VIVVMMAIVLCAGIGVAATNVARASASHTRDRARARAHQTAVEAQVLAQRLRSERAALARSITFSPPSGAVDVAPNAPIVVAGGSARLSTVRVSGPGGQPVSGAFGSSMHEWRSNALLLPASSYRVTATTVGRSRMKVDASSTFHTLTPAGRVAAALFPGDGMTVGVAQPIVVRFDHSVDSDAARAGVLSHFTVTASRPVSGGWHWFNDHELHFRPQQFWPPGEQVTIGADLDGWDAGNGLWGEGQSQVHFAIGPAHISVANLATDQMTVTQDGRTVATYPFSGGRPDDPTMNGIHVVLDRESVVRMVSSTNGIPVNSPDGYDELVYSDVHISDSGEYVHAAPWSVGSQGRTNVSHGCINLSPANALAFFGFSRVGDVVEVVGGPRPPMPGDHGVIDWETKWSQWAPAVVHHM
jgi:lipoprotein-anchoring transpeptidase ErfK/SrfK